MTGWADALARTPFWFLRHGETDWNTRGLTQGNTDIPLNETGLAQASQAAAELAGRGIARIVSSPKGRAVQTATIVAEALRLAVAYEPDLREASFGDQEGREMGSWYDRWIAGVYTPAGGESFDAVGARVIPAMNRVLAEDGLVLVVAHGGMFRAVRYAMGLSAAVRTPNGAAYLCRPAKVGWTLEP